MPPKSKLWLFIIMKWQAYRLARLIEKINRFQHRGTHWWAALLYQKQRNRSGLNNWLGCFALWYTSNFNLCMLIKENGQSAFAGFHLFSRPTMMGAWKGIQWVPRSKQRLSQCRLSPNCYLALEKLFNPGRFAKREGAEMKWVFIVPSHVK